MHNLSFLLLLVSISTPGWAQTGALSPEQTSSANALVGSFYTALSGEDADLIRDLFHPAANLFLLGPAGEGGAPAGSMRPDNLMSFAGFYRKDAIQQRIAAQYHGFDDVAQILSTFEWRHPETYVMQERGVDSFQLSYDGERWWVMSVVRQLESAAMPIPERFLPAPVLSRDTPPTVQLPAELERILRDYEERWRNGQARELAELFTHDGFVLPSGRPPRQGREAIADGYGSTGGDLRLRPISYATNGNTGYILGTYGYGEEGGDIGKWILAIRQDADGRWLIAADMDNASR